MIGKKSKLKGVRNKFSANVTSVDVEISGSAHLKRIRSN